MHCILTTTKEFKELLTQTKLDERTLKAAIAVWQEDNGVDNWPTMGQLYSILDRDTQTSIKPGVTEVFESNPELANIGTQEQYSQYLDTIFPNSKVKDIVYHGSDRHDIEIFKSSSNKYFFTANKDYAYSLSDNAIYQKELRGEIKEGKLITKVYAVILNISNIYNTNKELQWSITKKEGYDGIRGNDFGVQSKLNNKEEYVVFEPEQIHILGSKQDIEGFKKFINSQKEITSKIKSSGLPDLNINC